MLFEQHVQRKSFKNFSSQYEYKQCKGTENFQNMSNTCLDICIGRIRRTNRYYTRIPIYLKYLRCCYVIFCHSYYRIIDQFSSFKENFIIYPTYFCFVFFQVSGYLNLMANSIDNFTHGLAVGGSFMLSTRVGFFTTFAILGIYLKLPTNG